MKANKFPLQGWESNKVIEFLKELKGNDVNWLKGRSFGAVYYPGDEYAKTIEFAYQLYIHENALDPQLFKSAVELEKDIVRKVSSLFSIEKTISGTLTSGGTESIFLAVYSAKMHAKSMGKSNFEIIIPESAHPAFLKACNYLSVNAIEVKLNNEFNLEVKDVESKITSNTILLVGSSPAYPYGLMDPIDGLSKLALKHNILLHVDACIGGFMLPFLKRMGKVIPSFDFSLDGVTSMSVDIHKYGYAPKGASLILYRNRTLRKNQFTVSSSWKGGVYASTGFLGTKPGGALAAAWAAIHTIGEEGYMSLVKKTINARQIIIEGVNENKELEVIGSPIMSLLAIKSIGNTDVYEIADELNKRGWYVGRLQNPPALHLVISQIHGDSNTANEFIADLNDSVDYVSSFHLTRIVRKTGEKVGVKLLSLLPFNWMRKTVVKSSKSSVKDKVKRTKMIYDLKADLTQKSSNELFSSIIDELYS
jgi:sphinganine-1-phosphate aldolase